MAVYKTRQKDSLLGYLSAHSERPLSIDEICEGLAALPERPGRSTVYRLVNRLVEDGDVLRFEQDKKFFYQMPGGAECHHHLHLKCTGCGKLLHMTHDQSERIIEAIYGSDGFSVSETETTLFGTCEDCRNEKEKIKDKR